MRLRALAVLMPAFAGPAHAAGQNTVTDTSAQVLAHWQPGDARTWAVERVKTGRRPGTATFRLSLRVIDATDSTYLVEARYTNVSATAVTPGDPRGRAVMERLLHANEGLRVVFLTDGTGVPLSLVNEQEIAEHGRSVLAGILDMATSPEERLHMELALENVLSAHELAQGALEDIGNLLFAFGVEYRLGITEHAHAVVPDPLGGPPLPVRQECTLVQVDPGARRATLLMDQRIDPRTLEDGLEDRILAMGGAPRTSVEREDLRAAIRSVRITDRMRTELDLNGAWVIHAAFERTTEVHGMREADVRTYSLR